MPLNSREAQMDAPLKGFSTKAAGSSQRGRRLLFIAPLPPPINGHSVAASVLFDNLKSRYDVHVVNLRKESLKHGIDSLKRIKEILCIFYEVYKNRKSVDIVYFTISESLAGNLKDLVIYLLCFKLLPRMYIHLHGGSLRKLLLDRYKVIFLLNKLLLRRLAGAIVSGPAHVAIFETIIEPSRIHIAENFAQEHLFATDEQVIAKFSRRTPIRVLYINSLTRNKGYEYLADAYLSANDNIKENFRIDFAGAFDTEINKRLFLEKIGTTRKLYYHGVIPESDKQLLFREAHIFCLPTSFLEGQPLSILEAYAAGCVVITTGQPGIKDVFAHELNGFEIAEKSAPDIVRTLNRILTNPSDLLRIAKYNRKLAEQRYTTSRYVARLNAIIGPLESA